MPSSPRPMRPLTGGAVQAAASQFAGAAAGALTTLILARVLGADGAGVFAIALTLVLGLMTLGTFGLHTGAIYMVGAGRWHARRALWETQLAAVVLGLMAVGLALALHAVVGSALRGLDRELVVVTAGAAPFALSWTFASSVVLAADHYELFALAPALQAVVGLLVAPALGAAWGVEAAIAGLTASHAATAVVTLIVCDRAVRHGVAPDPELGSDGRAPPLWQAARFGLKTHLANALAFLNYRLDLFILNATASAAQVGRYSIAVSVTQALWLMPRALSAVVMPRVAQMSSDKSALGIEYQELVERKSLRHTTLLGVLSALVLALALVVLVKGFLGSDFDDSIVLGLILLPGSVLLGVAGSMAAILVGRGRPEFALWGAVITTPVAIVLFIVLVPWLEATGAAVASTVAYGFGFLVSVSLYRRMTGVSVLPWLVPGRAELDDYRGALTSIWRRVRRSA